MTLDIELIKEAEKEFWNKYHEKIESLGYVLAKGSHFLRDSKKISLVAVIIPPYPEDIEKKIRTIIPFEYTYKNEKIPVIISPSIWDMLKVVYY